ncbi:energy transducer TonB [Roseivirga sp.]|uniref:energy transducer TonB n=1 Tax=Roseivirga sp. TaxID=1964215 RepID=UPI003B8B6637
MKYKFVNKAKNLTPDDIKAQMNFDNVVKGASIWAGFKLGSALLKLGSKATASIVAGTSTVVVTTAIVVGTTTDVFKKNDSPEEQFVATEIQVEDEPKEEEVAKEAVVVDSLANIAKPKPVPVKPAPKTKVVSPIATNANPVFEAPAQIVYEDIKTNAGPLPSVAAFKTFIDNELVYPVHQIGIGDDEVQNLEGYVEVFWTVNRKGEATNFKIRKSLGEAYDNEAIRVIKKYKNWSPATFNGDAVESNLRFRILFKKM